MEKREIVMHGVFMFTAAWRGEEKRAAELRRKRGGGKGGQGSHRAGHNSGTTEAL